MSPHLEPTEAAAIALIRRGLTGPVVMLNLMRFRAIADYAATPALAPPRPISGAAAYDLYAAETRPHLEASGGEVLFDGFGGPWFIGPAGEHWHRVLLVRQASLEAFLAFARNETYLGILGHRAAALEDSRLLPLLPGQGFAG